MYEVVSDMRISTEPASRFAWPGAVVEYDVHAEGATELLLPESCPSGLESRVKDSERTDAGVDAHVEVRVRDDASMD